MPALYLASCPICQTHGSFTRAIYPSGARSDRDYECVVCGSVLRWLGDEHWARGDRWAFQRIHREDKLHLLQKPMTVAELQELTGTQPPAPDGPGASVEVLEAEEYEIGPLAPAREAPDDAPPSVDGPAEPPRSHEVLDEQAVPEAVTYKAFEHEVTPDAPARVEREPAPQPEVRAIVPVAPGVGDQAVVLVVPLREYERIAPILFPDQDYQAWVPSAQPRRSRGSPLLWICVALTLLCMACAASAIIANEAVNDPLVLSSLPLGPLAPTAVVLPSGTLAPTATPTPTSTPAPTATPTPTVTPSPTPTATPTPMPTTPPVVVFQGTTDYIAGSGSRYVVGEILNRAGYNLRFVELLASYYDANGQVVGSGSTFAELNIVEVGGTAPFKLLAPEPYPALDHYELQIDYMTTDLDPVDLEMLGHSGSLADTGAYHIAGEVRNPHQFSVRFAEVVATFYSPANEVIRVETVFAELATLEPGETSPFELILIDPPPDLDHYKLQTEAVRE